MFRSRPRRYPPDAMFKWRDQLSLRSSSHRLAVVGLLLAAFGTSTAFAEPRTWRSQKGKKLEADLAGVEGDQVVLAKPGEPEKQIRFPIASLVEKDQEYIAAWQGNRESIMGQLLWPHAVRAKPKPGSKGSGSKKKDKKAQEPPPAPTPVEGEAGAGTEPRVEELFTNAEAPAVKVKYYVLYFSGKWSPHDRAFTPKLVQLYRDKGPKNSKSETGSGLDWEVFLVSADRSEADMAAYMQEFNMPWPALGYAEGLRSPLVRLRGPGLPCLVVVDPTGKVLVDTFEGGEFRGPAAALEDLRKLLEGGAEALTAAKR